MAGAVGAGQQVRVPVELVGGSGEVGLRELARRVEPLVALGRPGRAPTAARAPPGPSPRRASRLISRTVSATSAGGRGSGRTAARRYSGPVWRHAVGERSQPSGEPVVSGRSRAASGHTAQAASRASRRRRSCLRRNRKVASRHPTRSVAEAAAHRSRCGRGGSLRAAHQPGARRRGNGSGPLRHPLATARAAGLSWLHGRIRPPTSRAPPSPPHAQQPLRPPAAAPPARRCAHPAAGRSPGNEAKSILPVRTRLRRRWNARRRRLPT